ncbi:hypothetical protein LQ327_27060 [Actinomycetospora endophytica]|uniref:Uncharacterized protein n=1 Tax=Actinomycetospora endophytica TaxID=2291215 RepID=A0ABS8PFJ6_9PSEU|nr:hypothetical protein [Actinomycetospora endophytica]MCD2197037.1 hypothetical protein [Actinomycetospora endophytica]
MRWRIDAVLAVLWALGGVVVAGYFCYLALGPPALGSPVPLVVLAVVALVGFSTVAWRHHRRDRETRAERSSGPVGGWVGRRVPDDGGRVAGGRDPAAPPQLSDRGKAELARIVGIADHAGLFAPRAPAPVDLVEAVADGGEPVTLDVVLAAVEEADFWRPGFRAEDHLAALAFHASHTEQLAETLRGQVEDLARLVGDVFTVRLVDVDLTAGGRTRLGLELGPVGGPRHRRTLDYRGAATYLSTELHVAVAGALRAATPPSSSGWPRLAWTWSDQGVWLAALRGTSVEALDAELGRAIADPWCWVDEQEPVAAGDRPGP